MSPKKQKRMSLLRRILTPVIATGLMLVFWMYFKNNIPFWWIAVAIAIFILNYAYSLYQSRILADDVDDDEKLDLEEYE